MVYKTQKQKKQAIKEQGPVGTVQIKETIITKGGPFFNWTTSENKNKDSMSL